MTKVYLVDGTFELFRAYYSSPKSKNSQGVEVGATKGLIRNIRSLLTPETYIACAFDHVIESFRNDLFDGYKTSEGIEPDLFNQFHIAEEECRKLGVVVWPMIEFEADDALATGAKIYSSLPKVEQVILCSPDKDLAQCVTGNKVVLWDRIRNKIYDEEGVIEKFGIGPKSIPDYLGLVGDTSDGIPGLNGWGAKAASTILAEYKNIENVPKIHNEWKCKIRGAEKLAQTLKDNFKDALLYKRLATLVTSVPLKETLDNLLWKS